MPITEKVKAILEANPQATVREIATTLGIKGGLVRVVMNRLKKA